MNDSVFIVLFLLVALATVAALLVALVGLALVIPASTRRNGARLLLIGGIGLVVFAGTCFGVLPRVSG